MTKRLLPCVPYLASVCCLVPFAGCHDLGGSFTPFATVTTEVPLGAEAQRLVVTARVGDVVISPSSGATVKIEAEVRVRADRVDVEKAGKAFEDHVRVNAQGGVLTIEDAHRERPDREDWSVALRVAMPRPLATTAVTDVGNVEVRTASGEVSARTGVGNAGLSVGDIASASVTSGVGNVTASVAGVTGKTVFTTGTGNIKAVFSETAPRGDVSATSGVGNVHVTVPADVAGKFSARTGVGHLSVEGLSGVVVSNSFAGAEASGTVGSGGPQYTLSSGTGSVTVRAGK